ncbi:MAG: glycosyltransferase [Gemmatimonadaceae bacterium]
MTERTDVAVVITAHNAAATLGATLRALATQSHNADGTLQVVVVDDRSTDGTSAIAASVGMVNVRTLRIDAVPSARACTARQHALDVAVRETRAPYVLVLDSDAVPPPGWVRDAVAALRDAAAVAGGVAFTPTSRSLSARMLAALQTVDAAYYLGWCRALTRSGAPAGMLFGAAGFRRALYDRIGGFCALGFTLIEDLAFARAAHGLDAKIVFLAGEPVHVRACARWRDLLGRALRTGTTGGRSLLAAALGVWGFLLAVLGAAALIAGGGWWIALVTRYLAGVLFASVALRRVHRLRYVPAALIYEPTALVLGFVVMGAALRVREIEWGGVRYPRQGSFSTPRA